MFGTLRNLQGRAGALVDALIDLLGRVGRTTITGDPPRITAGGQTNWASHNLDSYNQLFAELDQIDVESAGRRAPA